MLNQTSRTTRRTVKSLTAFGTYGFLSVLIAAQMAASPSLFAAGLADKADRAGVDAKKSARSVKRDVTKAARKATGQDNAWDDLKDKASDVGANIKDEADYHTRKIQRKGAE
jgi:hypothetical protein